MARPIDLTPVLMIRPIIHSMTSARGSNATLEPTPTNPQHSIASQHLITASTTNSTPTGPPTIPQLHIRPDRLPSPQPPNQHRQPPVFHPASTAQPSDGQLVTTTQPQPSTIQRVSTSTDTDPDATPQTSILPSTVRGQINPYTQGNSFTRFLTTITTTNAVFDASLPTDALPPLVANAFHARTLPPQHIQRRLATIYTIPQEEFPTYPEPDLDATQEPPRPSNVPCEFNHPWGDSFNESKPSQHTRIYFQNVYGLRLTTAGITKWQDCISQMHQHQCDIFGLAETNCNWSRNRVRHRITATASQVLPQLRLATSQNSYVHDSDYLPGGTITCTQGPWSGRIQQTLQDPHKMGRWSGQLYKVHAGCKFAVITAYRVCKQDTTDGVYSSYKQQQLSLRSRTGPQHQICPRNAFIGDLIEYTHSLQLTNQDYLLIMLDANEVMGEDLYGIVNLMEQLGLVDLLERHHQLSCDIATHANSKHRRIDYVLGSNNLVQFVTKCGYLPFQSGINSDHRACFLELNQDFVDGRARQHKPPTRMIGYNTTKTEVLKYKEFIQSEFTTYDIFERAKALYEQATFPMANEQLFISELNALDREVTNIMIKAEKTQCSKKPPFKWSPAVHQASLLIKYWSIKQNSDRKGTDRKQQLQDIYQQLEKEAQMDIDASNTTHNTSSTTKLHHAKIDKQRLHLKNKNARASTKRRRMEADAEFYAVTPEQALKRIGMKEESAHLFRYLDKVYTKNKGLGINHIEIPYKDVHGYLTNDPLLAAEWVKVTDPEEFVPIIVARNISHFGQAQHSPFATAPLLDVFGYTGTTASANALIDQGILPASCTADEVHKGAKDILRKLADRQNTTSNSFHVESEEFWSAFQKWDERTSTSPSNRHLGHYKVLQLSDGNDANYKSKHTSPSDLEDDPGPEKPPNPSEAIKQVYYHIAVAAAKSGNTLERWCNSSSLMLEKLPGSPKIHKLRVIHIYEADYNLMLKILWARQLVWSGHLNQSFHEGQAGSRPDHRCSDVIIRKEMNYLYARLTRTALATVDNDAKACYDRILCNLAMMVSRYYGMSEAACKFHSTTLQAMRYRVRTTTSGDSNQVYRHTQETPIHGSGQGSCASPALWLLISCILLKVFDTKAQGMAQFDVNKERQKVTSAEGFVNDVALFTNLHALIEADLPTLRQALSQDINTWQTTIAGSGGKLELIKCFYYILMWKFNKMGDPSPLTNQELIDLGHTDITIMDPDSKEHVALEHKSVEEVHRTLGAFKTISGDESSQFQVLLEKSNKLAVCTAQGQLTRLQARRAYSSIYIPSISYSLVTTNLSQKLMADIQSKAMLAFLPAMGFERTFPRAVVFGPVMFGGLNLCNLYTETCIAKVGSVISHIRKSTGLGKLMVINSNWLQLHAGLLESIFINTVPLPYLKQNWLLHMREFLWHTKSHICVPELWVPKLRRRNDCTLMEKFSSLSIGTDVLRIVNNWRLHFRVILLSDIVTADGLRIQARYWHPGRHNYDLSTESTSTINWPIQHRPDVSQYGKWIRCIKAAFRIDESSGLLPVHLQLGDWTCHHADHQASWLHYFDHHSSCLYTQNTSPSWSVHPVQPHPSGRHNPHDNIFQTVPDDVTMTLPMNAFPVTVSQSTTNLTVRHRQFQGPYTQYVADVHTFDEHIHQLPKWRGDILMHWSSASVAQIQQLLADNTRIYLASDGAFNEENGTGAFGVVIGTHSDELMTNQGTAPGTVWLHSSFRSEMYGLLAGCLLLTEITRYCKLTITETHHLSIYLDNKGVLDRINRHTRHPVALCEMLSPDIDIELQILSELRTIADLGFDIEPIKHVRAHQDNKKQFFDLSRDAQLNVRADRLAAQVTSDNLIEIEYSVPPACRASLYINNHAITNKYRESLRRAHDSQALREYMQQKYLWSDTTVEDIWWNGHDRAIRRLSHADRQTIQKFNFHHLPTLRRERFKNSDIPDHCPHCNLNEIETDDHILLCTSTLRMKAKLHWDKIVSEYLSREHTPLVVKQAIMLGLHHWILCQPIPNIETRFSHLPQPIKAAYKAQTAIGWDHLIRGRCSSQWQPIIQHHLKTSPTPGSTTTSTNWVTGLILACWNGILSIWEVRNREYHGHDDETQQAALKGRLMKEALPYLSHATKVHPNDRHWFDHTATTLEEYNVVSLKAWIRNARTIVRIHHCEFTSAIVINPVTLSHSVMIPISAPATVGGETAIDSEEETQGPTSC